MYIKENKAMTNFITEIKLYINQKLLISDISQLTNQEKNMLSSLYFYTLTNINSENLLVESNITIKKGQ